MLKNQNKGISGGLLVVKIDFSIIDYFTIDLSLRSIFVLLIDFD